MRLLNARTLKLKEFFDSQIPKYAILSHTWRDDEVLFRDIEHDHAAAQRKSGWAKIEKTCRIARSHSLDWVWIDTCCIDKSSSAELSEAINSMFRWYANATICYAFLDDVPAGSSIDSQGSPFSKGRWFTRGFTLQELIAPLHLIFYVENRSTGHWFRLGAKDDLADVLSAITGIPAPFLTGRSLAVASIAQRMSWASRRSTTREEDIAYCLLGLFDVNMPLLYGEGAKAFIRLQEEIVRTSSDQSVLAWGVHAQGTGPDALQAQAIYSENYRSADDHIGGVFASHPSWFGNSGRVHSYQTAGSGLYELSNQGLRISSPLIAFYNSIMFGIVYLCLDCYENDFLNRIAIPLMHHTSGRYHRLRPTLVSPISLDQLIESNDYYCSSLVDVLEDPPHVSDRQAITIYKGVDANTHTQKPEWGTLNPYDDVFILRRVLFEVWDIYPRNDTVRDKHIVVAPRLPGRLSVSMLLRHRLHSWALVVNLRFREFGSSFVSIRCLTLLERGEGSNVNLALQDDIVRKVPKLDALRTSAPQCTEYRYAVSDVENIIIHTYREDVFVGIQEYRCSIDIRTLNSINSSSRTVPKPQENSADTIGTKVSDNHQTPNA